MGTEYPDLAVLDLGLPDGDGLALLDRVRESDRVGSRIDPDLPVMILSGRATELERIRGLTRGADGYITKPFSYLEFRARVDAVLRRRDRGAVAARLRAGPLEIDVLSRQVWLDGDPVSLSVKEFSLLRTLATEPHRVFTREELLRIVWGFRSAGTTRTVDTHVSRLRRKLAPAGAGFIINVWGVGYRLLDGSSDRRR